MPAPKVSKAASLARQREDRAWFWRVRGLSQQAIADKLAEEGLGPVTGQAVGKMLARIADRLQGELTDRAKREMLRQLDALDRHYAEAMGAWDRSKQDEQRLSKKEIKPDEPPPGPLGVPAGAGKPGRVEETMTVAAQCGERGYLAEARATLADIRKLLGIDAPERRQVEHTGAGGRPIAMALAVDVTGLDDDVLEEMDDVIAKVEQRARHRQGGGGSNGFAEHPA